MFGNYLKLTLRNLLSNAFYAFINIIGLGMALAICIVAYINNRYDARFDAQHNNGDSIYKVEFTRTVNDRSQPYGISPMSLGPLIENNVGGVESVVRICRTYSPIKFGEKNFTKSIAYVDDGFFNMFTVPLISGTAKTLPDRNNILIDDELAGIYFGEEDPIGKIISVFNDQGREFTFLVSGVFRKFPQNSSFHNLQAITSIDNFIDMWEAREDDWKTWVAGTFLMIPDKQQVAGVEASIQQYVAPYNAAREDFLMDSLYLEPLTEMAHHAWKIWANWFSQSFHPAAVTAPPLMALFILLLACINFTNTSIAFSSRRIKEIGMRKVVGGHRSQIRLQFFGEYFTLSLIALVIGIGMARWLAGVYSGMWDYLTISLSFRNDPLLIAFLLGLVLLTTLMAGAYPAFYVSRFNPILIFQDKYKLGGRNLLSLILLGFNFLIAVNAITSGLYYYQNAIYQNNLDLGYDKESIISVPFQDRSSLEAYRNRITGNPMIESMAGSDNHINWSSYSLPVKFGEKEESVRMMNIGHGYFRTMGLNLLEGREFDPELEKSDLEGNVVVSRKLLEDFGIADPLGKRLVMNDTVYLNIIGVMDDFYPSGVWNKIEPTLFRLSPKDRLRMLVVRTSPDNLKTLNQYLEEVWKEMIPEYPYRGFFQEETLAEARDINRNIKNIYIFLAAIATLLSAIGLYSMISLLIIRRTKEIGIRKVLGAGTRDIVYRLARTFTYIIGVSCILGIVTGWYLSRVMMESIWDVFADANLLTVILPFILIMAITLATMSGRIWEAASRNPSESLRYE